MYKRIVFITFLLLSGLSFTAISSNLPEAEKNNSVPAPSDTLLKSKAGDTAVVQLNNKCSLSEVELPASDNQKKKKRIAAISAFPFPFGFVGTHRVMLGTKPWVPIIYAATFGGCFGLLPLIDFCVIVFSNDITQYENNPNVFMWIK